MRAALDHPRVRTVAWTTGAAFVLYSVIQRFWPSPAGILVVGAVLGSLSALVAFGIVLVYRANRIVNFAQGDIGGAAAALAVQLVVGPRVPYLVAVPLGLIAALAVGGALEVLVIRRFSRSPRLVLTVATIGLAQILAATEIAIPRVFRQEIPSQRFPTPFGRFTFSMGPVVLTGNHIVAVAVVLAVILGLAAFFRRTRVGVAVRASAESADRASLLGIPVRRISTLVWMLAAGLSALGLMLRAPLVGLPIGTVLGPAVLLRALAAAVIGRMENLPVTFFASVGLGVLEQAIFWKTSRSLIADAFLFFVILAALLLQRRGEVSRAEEVEASSWAQASEVRPVPTELRSLPEVRWGLSGLRGGGVALAIGLAFLLPPSRLNLLSLVLIYSIIGISLVVLTGWAGQVSLGQVALAGFGAAIAGVVTGTEGVRFLPAILAAAVAGAAIAIVIGLPALRIRGLFLAVTTLAFALVSQAFFLNREFFPWLIPEQRVPRPVLLGVRFTSERAFYLFVLAFVALALRTVRIARRSRTGRALIAVRDNPRAAQAFGVNLTRAKLSAFALSGFLAGLAGALLVFHQRGFFSTTPFGAEASLKMFAMVVIGGLGSVPGAILGSFYVRSAEYFLPAAFRFLATGFGMLVLLMVFPGGLGQVLYGIRDGILRRVAGRRGLTVPSLVADRREPLETTVRTGAPRSARARGVAGRSEKEPVKGGAK